MVDFQIFPLELPSIGDFPLPRLITIGLWCPFANMILGYMGAPLQSHAKSCKVKYMTWSPWSLKI